MAPMIDMVFLLLVFFMTVSTLARDARPELELPVSVTAGVPEEVPPRDVLTLLGDGDSIRYFWHNRPVRREELADLLAPGPGQLLLRGGPELPWSAWSAILDTVRKSGRDDLVIATFEP